MKKLAYAALALVGAAVIGAVGFSPSDALAADKWLGVNNNVDAGTAQLTVPVNSQIKLVCANPGCYKVGSSGETLVANCTKDFPVGQATIVALPYGPIAMGNDTAIATAGLTDAGVVVRQNCNVYQVTGSN